MNTHWHILGAGAIGCHWAAALNQAGSLVSLIVRDRQRLEQLHDNGGLTVQDGDSCLHLPVEGLLAEDCPPIDNLLVTTKAYDSLAAVRSLSHRLHTGSRILLLQNGMGSQQQVLQAFPGLDIWAGSSTDGAWLRAPFQVVIAGRGSTLVGPLQQTNHTPLFSQSPVGLTLQYEPEIELNLWRKLTINCAINPLTALHNCQNGQLEQNPELRHEMEQVCTEIDQLLTALQLDLFAGSVFTQALAVARQTGNNFSSMLQDVRQRRRTEIDYITGYLLQRAREAGISLPVNEALYRSITDLQQSYLEQTDNKESTGV